jgi:competence protein ComEA
MRRWREAAWPLAFGVVFGLFAAGILFVVCSPPRGVPVSLAPPPSPSPYSVYVSGAVQNPGVYLLHRDSRVQDALLAAGGILPEANEQALNLASLITDGARLHVPVQSLPKEVDGQVVVYVGDPAQAGLVNINTAGPTELETLPGIGPALAARIIAFREENGAFALVDDLINVPGIGPVKLKGLKDLVVVEDFR